MTATKTPVLQRTYTPPMPLGMLHRIWCCPSCQGNLVVTSAISTNCGKCGATYEIFDGIPDLRLPGESWIDYEEDRHLSRRFIEETSRLTLEEQLAWCFGARGTFTRKEIDVRVGQVINSIKHLGAQVDGWLSPCLEFGTITLDLGCGPGQLIAAASHEKRQVIGIDVRLLWLLAAKRLITAYGGTPVLACALAEHMPLKNGAVHSVISLDVIEHVADVPAYLREIDRVISRTGTVALSTPNRFSLAAEPHVGVWGVGWVPRRWQKQFVKWRKRIDYPYTRLLSVPETHRLISSNTKFKAQMVVPTVAEHEIERFPQYRRVLARVFNAMVALRIFTVPLLAVGPFFRVVGRKRP